MKTKITQKEAKLYGILMSQLKEYNVFYRLENGDIVDIGGNIRAYGKEKNNLIDALNLINDFVYKNVTNSKEIEAVKILKNFILK